ncbi:MAG: hypothetical protein HOK83_12230, partial [Rhodospirillaceae bacterium]|nr:hypothetical protein [Rhodospirillaceae bacterium]
MPLQTNRRSLLLCAGAAALMPVATRAGAQASLVTTGTRRQGYDVTWTGIPVGRHAISVSDDGGPGNFTVTNQVDMMVDLVLFDVMRFEHTSSETWREGKMVAFSSTTLDDGDLFEVTGRATSDGLVFTTTERDTNNSDATIKETEAFAPHDIMTSNDIWVAPEPGTHPLLNAKKGEIVTVTVQQPANTTLSYQGMSHEAQRYRVTSPVAVGDLLYLGDLFVEGSFEKRGYTVDY